MPRCPSHLPKHILGARGAVEPIPHWFPPSQPHQFGFIIWSIVQPQCSCCLCPGVASLRSRLSPGLTQHTGAAWLPAFFGTLHPFPGHHCLTYNGFWVCAFLRVKSCVFPPSCLLRSSGTGLATGLGLVAAWVGAHHYAEPQWELLPGFCLVSCGYQPTLAIPVAVEAGDQYMLQVPGHACSVQYHPYACHLSAQPWTIFPNPFDFQVLPCCPVSTQSRSCPSCWPAMGILSRAQRTAQLL